MRCGKGRKMISARADGELDERRLTALERHLACCGTCRAFEADLALVAGKLDQVGCSEPRWGFADRVLARLPSADATPVKGVPAAETGSLFAGGWLDLLRPAPLGLGAAAFSLGVAVMILANGANGESSGQGAVGDPVLEAVAGDYATLYAEASVHEQLWNLLPDSED